MALAVSRAATERDYLELRLLFLEYELDLPHRLRHGRVPDASELESAYAEPNAAFLARRDGAPIGCVALTRRDGKTGLLRHLFVRPQSRGLGAARALVERVVEYLRAAGCRRVVLDTDKDVLQPAYRLYRNLGFAECAPHGIVGYDTPTFMELLL